MRETALRRAGEAIAVLFVAVCLGALAGIVGPPALNAPAAGRPASPMPMMPGMTGEPRTQPTAPRPFYREPSFFVLAGATAAGAGLVAYRVLRTRRRRGVSAINEAVLVVDLVASTHLATHYGDRLAMHARNTLKDLALEIAESHGLVFAENTGDGWFMTFPSVGAAVQTATDVMRSLRDNPPDLAPAPPLEARAAITYGEILLDARGSRHGATINKAFRVVGVTAESFAHVQGEDASPAGVADRNRVLLGEEAVEEIRAAGVPCRFVGFCRLKGFSGLHGVYEVLWRPDS